VFSTVYDPERVQALAVAPPGATRQRRLTLIKHEAVLYVHLDPKLPIFATEVRFYREVLASGTAVIDPRQDTFSYVHSAWLLA
jgi:hypothetical protein